jgi:fructose-1,6-bisphosphatase/inositol monophosphatase family enzyme
MVSMEKALSGFERCEYLDVLGNVALKVGEMVNRFQGDIYDTTVKKGHEESSLDKYALECVKECFSDCYENLPEEKKFKGGYVFEGQTISPSDPNCNFYMLIDEYDGTSNGKRSLSSPIPSKPEATVSLAFVEGVTMGDIAASAVYDLHNEDLFTSVKSDDGYYNSFFNGDGLLPDCFAKKRGDSSNRVMVVGYSNKERYGKARLEKRLIENGYRVYDGCRASSFDVLNILRNKWDAYVDARALWPESGAMLNTYDIAGVMAIAKGCGLEVSSILGSPIEKRNIMGDPIDIIISRPEIGNDMRFLTRRNF